MANNLECMKILIDTGAIINIQNKDSIHENGIVETGGRSPLHLASQNGITLIKHIIFVFFLFYCYVIIFYYFILFYLFYIIII